MKYSIPEQNLESLEKKLKKIQHKCAKYGCEFSYERIGEHFEERAFSLPTEEQSGPHKTYTEIVKFIDVEVEGRAAVNGWRFAATLDYTDKGNIIKGVEGLEIPEKYYSCSPWCEHCRTRRGRSTSFIVYHEETGEFKQVGRSCLRDFTGGLSAENVAQFESFFKECEEASELSGCGWYGSGSYFEVPRFLTVAAETIRIYGYCKSKFEGMTTASRAENFYRLENGMRLGVGAKEIETMYEEALAKGFNTKRPETIGQAEAVRRWICENERDDNYFHNLKVACSLDYCDSSKLGLLVSAFPAYDRELEYAAEKREREAAEAEARAKSSWLGSVGDKVSFEIADFRVISSWETQWGTTAVYKFTDKEGHEVTWKTTSWVNDRRIVGARISGKVKERKEYRGIKQTELTRCKLEYAPEREEQHESSTWDDSVLDEFLSA